MYEKAGWMLVAGILVVSVLSRVEAQPEHHVVKAEPDTEWDAKFAGMKGWIGGDGVYTVALKPKHILWLFGDTLLGTVKDGGRAGARMVNNTIAIQSGSEKAALRFLTGKSRDDKPAAFFLPSDGKGWFWPLAAVRVEERLFVFLAQIDKGTNPGVFGFRQIGQWLAIIENPDEDPMQWRVKQQQIPFARFRPGQVQSWGSAVLTVGATVYVFGYQEQGKGIGRRKLLVARVPAQKLADFTAWEFRAAEGWTRNADEATPLAAGLATEFSVTPVPGGKGYTLVYTENGLSDRILGRFASDPAGPWSEPLLLYHCPEMARDKGVFCYAAKAHPWAATEEELLISYCVNTWDFGRLFRDEKVYRPHFVRVKLAATK